MALGSKCGGSTGSTGGIVLDNNIYVAKIIRIITTSKIIFYQSVVVEIIKGREFAVSLPSY